MSSAVQLRPVSYAAVAAVVDGRRLDDWAPDFPDEGDRVVAGLIERRGPRSLDAGPWGHRHVVERDSGLVVGGAGFFGEPVQGEIEIGYGIVPSRQGRGYATEVVAQLLSIAWAAGASAVVAGTDADNEPSQRVLEKNGFRRVADQGETRRYRIQAPVG